MNNQHLGLGFFAPIAVNALDKSLIGVADIELFERNETEEEKGLSTAEKRKRQRKKDFEEKESYRWPERAIEAKNQFGAEQKVIAVQGIGKAIYMKVYAY
ncbi:hypothetical protein FACS1894200_09670 [Spirochaetia bacterium]|nr:hypothetical protein FACS1894200_09670 [Spirochaetia bacterium]